MDVTDSWHSFYGLIGGAAASLLGLMFVAVSVGAKQITREMMPKVHVLATPTVIYLGAALLISATMLFPQRSARSVEIEAAAIAVCGLVYELRLKRNRNAELRNADPEMKALADIWQRTYLRRIVLYLLILASSISAEFSLSVMLVLLAVGMIAVLTYAIYSAWEAVLFLAVLVE